MSILHVWVRLHSCEWFENEIYVGRLNNHIDLWMSINSVDNLQCMVMEPWWVVACELNNMV